MFFIFILPNKTLFLEYPAILALGGNERADSAAKSALNLPHAKVGVPYNDFKHYINQIYFFHFILSSQSWEIGSPPTGGAGRIILLCRTRISHTHLTHSYILKKYPPPLCKYCQCIGVVQSFCLRKEIYIW